MNEQHQYNMDYLHIISEGKISEFTHEQVEHLRHFVDNVIKREQDGLDKLYESMAMMMKYVPNFILHSIAPKYIEPAIAARITSKLSVKQILGVTGGLPIEYVGEAAIHMDSKLSADVMNGLKKKMAAQVIEYVVNNHPLAALDILTHSPAPIRNQASRFFDRKMLRNADLNPIRQKICEELQLAG